MVPVLVPLVSGARAGPSPPGAGARTAPLLPNPGVLELPQSLLSDSSCLRW